MHERYRQTDKRQTGGRATTYSERERSLKRKLRVFEMSALRKICGITRKDRRRNVGILKELSVEKDIVDLSQVRRMTYYAGHVNRMATTDFESY